MEIKHERTPQYGRKIDSVLACLPSAVAAVLSRPPHRQRQTHVRDALQALPPPQSTPAQYSACEVHGIDCLLDPPRRNASPSPRLPRTAISPGCARATLPTAATGAHSTDVDHTSPRPPTHNPDRDRQEQVEAGFLRISEWAACCEWLLIPALHPASGPSVSGRCPIRQHPTDEYDLSTLSDGEQVGLTDEGLRATDRQTRPGEIATRLRAETQRIEHTRRRQGRRGRDVA